MSFNGEHTKTTEYPVGPLLDLYQENGSKDAMTRIAASQLVSSLVEFGVSPSNIAYHLQEAIKGLEGK